MSGNGWVCEPCGLEKLPSPDGAPVIRLIGVEKSLEGKKILDGIDLDIPRQRITALIGTSGAGKSVLLKHMIGLMMPDRGQVLVDGVEIARLSRAELYRMRRRFGMLFQGGALFDSLTVFENVAFPLRNVTFLLRDRKPLPEPEVRERVHQRLSQMGLEGHEKKYPDELSGGMVRRVALARAMVTDPEIILVDEPTAGLDPIIRNSILSLIGHTYHRHCFTMVMISHEMPEIFRWCHHVAVVHEGRVIEAGPTESVLKSGDPFVQQLLRGDIAGPVHLM